jgi:hypothetical protein
MPRRQQLQRTALSCLTTPQLPVVRAHAGPQLKNLTRTRPSFNRRAEVNQADLG